MRFYILRALLLKEVHRHFANRGGLALSLLLVVAAVLLSVFNPTASVAGGGAGGAAGGAAGETGGMVGGVHHCYIQYPDDSPFTRYLQEHVPPGLKNQLRFERVEPTRIDELVTYPPGVGAIQIRYERDRAGGRPVMKFSVWHPPGNPAAMAPFEDWFWKAARDALQRQAADALRAAGADPGRLHAPPPGSDDLWAVRDSFGQLAAQANRLAAAAPHPPAGPAVLPVVIERQGLGGKPLDLRSAVATAMVVFALYFSCVYLLPTLNCEERERGVLLAQALSPASPAEILTAKFLFYPLFGIGLAAMLAGIYKAEALSTLPFWLAVFTVACGFLGIGMTVATLAKTQRSAFMGSMCYLLSVALILMICQQNNIPGLPWLALEYHGPRVIHAAIIGEFQWDHWMHLVAAAVLAGGWLLAAGWLFRRRGWQ